MAGEAERIHDETLSHQLEISWYDDADALLHTDGDSDDCVLLNPDQLAELKAALASLLTTRTPSSIGLCEDELGDPATLQFNTETFILAKRNCGLEFSQPTAESLLEHLRKNSYRF